MKKFYLFHWTVKDSSESITYSLWLQLNFNFIKEEPMFMILRKDNADFVEELVYLNVLGINLQVLFKFLILLWVDNIL